MNDAPLTALVEHGDMALAAEALAERWRFLARRRPVGFGARRRWRAELRETQRLTEQVMRRLRESA